MSTTPVIPASSAALEILRNRAELVSHFGSIPLLHPGRQVPGHEGPPYLLRDVSEELATDSGRVHAMVGDVTLRVLPEHLALLQGSRLHLTVARCFGSSVIIASAATEDFSEQPSALVGEKNPTLFPRVGALPDATIQLAATAVLVARFEELEKSLTAELSAIREKMDLPEMVLSLSVLGQDEGEKGPPYSVCFGADDVPDETWDGEKVQVGNLLFHLHRGNAELLRGLTLSLAHSFGGEVFVAS
ncbi:hypothetical protein DB346_11290 [Verrucomicrobia bacterium LW23]|nr:hypothetical protein DB346_11290 [Verrucomicrobia bacterium LW23]